jgi:hypothetical protein
MGEAQVRVPDGVCVATRGTLGAGEAELPSGRQQGTNLDLDHAAGVSGARELVVVADLGVGHLAVERPLGGPCA